MPPVIAKLIGGAGTGKTSEMLRIMEGVVEKIYDPHLIGFVSFTRAARHEAAERAGDRFNVPAAELSQSGWFRTLHSVCHRCLGIQGNELITDNAESRTWINESLQEEVTTTGGNEDDTTEVFAGAVTDADKALQLWGTARNRLQPILVVWAQANAVDGTAPSYERCVSLIERYEQAKRLDGRLDFTDLLGRFAGYKFYVDGPLKTEPDGEPPELPVWFHDEMQDVSALSTAVFSRIIHAPGVDWVYLAGDPFQAIHQWAGADPACFLGYDATKERVMPKSWRCPEAILRYGEYILRDCSDYWDRGIAPVADGGDVSVEPYCRQFFEDLDPRESWLLLARTNWHARRLGRMLDELGLPWNSTKGRGGWDAPVRNQAIMAMLSIECGAPIDGSQWQHILKYVKSTVEGVKLLEQGTKSRFARMEPREAQDEYGWVTSSELHELGATQAFVDLVRAGKWRGWIDGAQIYAEAIQRYGEETVSNPGLKVGTIHSVKGGEADNVAVLSTISEPTFNATRTQQGKDEEQRVWYVAATRAKKRLVILHEHGCRFRKRLPEL